VLVVKMILPSTGHKMNFWQHHEQFRKFILEHTSIPRKRKPLKIIYFLYYTTVKPKAKTYSRDTFTDQGIVHLREVRCGVT